jgi:hypothetical protein
MTLVLSAEFKDSNKEQKEAATDELGQPNSRCFLIAVDTVHDALTLAKPVDTSRQRVFMISLPQASS